MFKRKAVDDKSRVVWRMTADNPTGSLLTIAGNRVLGAKAAEVQERWCGTSSFELSAGADVVESELNKLPAEWAAVFAELDNASER